MVKLGIFKVVFKGWSRDASFCSIFTAEYYTHISIAKKITWKPKITKLLIFWIFSKWRHSNRKWSVVVPYMTKWPYVHFWPHFRQKTYSGGILNILRMNYTFWWKYIISILATDDGKQKSSIIYIILPCLNVVNLL